MESAKQAYINLIEEISLNAWPSHKIELYDGWLLRFSHNYTHRTNSIQQVGESHISIEDKITYCESVYRNWHTPIIFKISPLVDPDFDELLARKGYEIEHITENLVMDLKDYNEYKPEHVEYEFYGRNSGLPSIMSYPDNVIVQLRDRITEEWINGLFSLNGTTNPTLRRIVPSMYHAIPKETIVAHIEVNGKMAACGLGILDRDHVGVYAIYVDPSCRRRHYAKSIVSAIITQAQKKGYHHAYLQCVKGNIGARNLYESLGFHHLYNYWFRVKQTNTF